MIPPLLLFGAIGVLNTCIDAGVYFLLTRGLDIGPEVANAISYTCGALNSYFMNGLLTFAASRSPFSSLAQIARFAAVNLTLLAANALIFRAALTFLPDLAAKATAIGAGFLVGYVANKRLVYQARFRGQGPTI